MLNPAMARHKRRSRKHGLPPGSIVYIGSPQTEPVTYSMFYYDGPELKEAQPRGPEECMALLEKARRSELGVVWLNIDGLHDTAAIEGVGKLFQLHPLVLEDIVNTTQRPKRVD